MPESPQKPRVPKSERRGVFRQGGSTPRVGLYARVSTHDQQTLPLQLSAMREHAGQGPQEPLLLTRPWTDPSWIFDVTARVAVGRRGSIYVNVRNLFDAHDITARLPFGARPVAPRWAQVGTTWSF